jgi:hypothetical protein
MRHPLDSKLSVVLEFRKNTSHCTNSFNELRLINNKKPFQTPFCDGTRYLQSHFFYVIVF